MSTAKVSPVSLLELRADRRVRPGSVRHRMPLERAKPAPRRATSSGWPRQAGNCEMLSFQKWGAFSNRVRIRQGQQLLKSLRQKLSAITVIRSLRQDIGFRNRSRGATAQH